MEFEEPCWDFTPVNQSSQQQQKPQQESLHPFESLSQKNFSFNSSQHAHNQQSEEFLQFPNGENTENDESSMQQIQFALIPLKFKPKYPSETKANQLKKIRNVIQNLNETNDYSHDSSSSKTPSSSLTANHLISKILNKKITSLNEKFKKRKQDQMIAYQQKINKFNHLIQCRRANHSNTKQAIAIPIDFVQTIQCTYEFQIFGGISISTDYSDNQVDPDTNERKPVVKCCNSMPCGTAFSEARVIFNKSLNSVEILSAPCFIGNKEFSALCEIFDSFNDMDYHLLSNTLKRYQNEVYKIVQNNIIFQNFPSRIQVEIEEDYQNFVEWARSQVPILTKGMPYFKFMIGRMNYNLGDVQMSNIGASLEFTKILGMDYEIFAQSVLRGQFSELGKIIGSNIDQAIYQLLLRIENQDLIPEQTILLSTIDGFKMTSKQTLMKIPSPFTRHLISEYDHLFYIELVNVEENQLKALEEFRQRQLDHQKGISFEQYAHRELSQFFEIVEYSVYSQIFLEKYYSKKE